MDILTQDYEDATKKYANLQDVLKQKKLQAYMEDPYYQAGVALEQPIDMRGAKPWQRLVMQLVQGIGGNALASYGRNNANETYSTLADQFVKDPYDTKISDPMLADAARQNVLSRNIADKAFKQQLQQEQQKGFAKEGFMVGPDGGVTLAPGYGEGIRLKKEAEYYGENPLSRQMAESLKTPDAAPQSDLVLDQADLSTDTPFAIKGPAADNTFGPLEKALGVTPEDQGASKAVPIEPIAPTVEKRIPVTSNTADFQRYLQEGLRQGRGDEGARKYADAMVKDNTVSPYTKSKDEQDRVIAGDNAVNAARSEVRQASPFQAFQQTIPILESMRANLDNETAIGDLEMIKGMAKAQDPAGSIMSSDVTTADLATLATKDRVFANFLNIFEKTGRLPREVRQNMIDIVANRAEAYRKNYEDIAAQAESRATSLGYRRPSDVRPIPKTTPIPEAVRGVSAAPSASAGPSPSATPPPKPGLEFAGRYDEKGRPVYKRLPVAAS